MRISDNTVLLANAQENLDKTRLATASVGLVVRRDTRLDYYLGNRYIADIHSNITTAAVDYQLTSKYSMSFSQSVDFGLGKNVESAFALSRRFDNFFLIIKATNDETTGQSGFGINILPVGVGYGINTDGLHDTLNSQRRLNGDGRTTTTDEQRPQMNNDHR